MTRNYLHLLASAGVAVVLLAPVVATAQTAPSLGNAGSFVVLAGSTVTNTGPSVLTGDLGVSPGSAIVGFPPGLVLGAIDAGGPSALAAQTSVTTAANALLAQACTTSFLVPTDIGNSTRGPGVYCFSSSAAITGPLTLDAGGNANAVFIFRTISTLVTASSSSVILINGAQPCNVFWRVGSSATLGTTTTFVGNILAQTSITLTTGATIQGRALAQTGAVTLDSNVVTRTFCAGAPGAPGVPGVPGAPGTPGCPTITLAPTTLPNGTVGVAYSQTITAGNALAPDTTYSFGVTAGGLPPGLVLSAAGVVSGTPLASGTSGTYSFTVRATAPNGCFASADFTMITVTAVPTLPQVFVFTLFAGLLLIGYVQMRRRARA